MRKALILGAGGTGANVISRVRELIEWRDVAGKNVNDYPNIKYFEVDTDPDSLRDGGSNSLYLRVSEEEVSSFKSAMDNDHHKWADRTGISAVTKGAGQTRVKGKFAFLYHYDNIKSAIQKRLSDLYDVVGDASQKKRIYIIANSVSGTGSGCFVDYGYLVREIIRGNTTYLNDTLLNVTLILTLPANNDNSLYLRNSYHALEELNHFMSGNTYNIEHAVNQDVMLKTDKEVTLFDYVYLIGPPKNKNTESQELENIIGEYIYNDIFSPSANTRDSARDNMNKWEVRKDLLGYIQRYMTFGFSTIEYPMMQISKAATYKNIENAIREWTKNVGALPPYAFENIFLIDGDYKTEGCVYHELLKETNVRILGGGRTQIMGVTAMIKRLKDVAFNNFKDNDYNTSYINGLLDSIDDGFKEGGQVGSEYGIGTIRAIIQENERALKSEDGGWAYRIKDNLLSLMFTTRDGIRLVEEVLEQINKQLDVISNRTAENTHEKLRGEIEELCSEIESIRTDGLLKFGGLHKLPIEQRINKCRKKIDAYIDSRLNAVAINAAKKIASKNTGANRDFGLREILENFEKRIKMFGQNIEEWMIALSAKYDDIISPKVINGHVVWRNRIGELAHNLIINASRSMFAFIDDPLNKAFRNKLMQDGTITDSVLIKRRDKENVIDSERRYFVRLLSDKKVIDEFLQEESDKSDMHENNAEDVYEDTINEVNNKAALFIDMSPRDGYTIGDDETLLKKWFFYPGGQAINTPSNSSNNLFAKELHKKHLINNWTEQSKDSSDERIILILQEKAGFPMRYLTMLYDRKMQNALEQAQQMKEHGVNTFISRVDVDFLPLKTISAAELNSVKVLFIESIATGKLTLRNNEFVYNQGGDNQNPFDFGDQETIKLPNQYSNAVYKLYKNVEAQNKLRSENEKYIRENEIKFLQDLNTLVNQVNVFGLLLSNDDIEKREIRRLIKEEYIKARGLTEKWNVLFPAAQIVEGLHSYQYIAKVDTDDTGHPRVGWYCNACGQFMGDARINGEPDPSSLIKFKAVHVCSR